MQFFGSDGYVKLYGNGLWVGTVNTTLPAFLIEGQVGSWILGVFGGDS
jgi:hypothetical protein